MKPSMSDATPVSAEAKDGSCGSREDFWKWRNGNAREKECAIRGWLCFKTRGYTSPCDDANAGGRLAGSAFGSWPEFSLGWLGEWEIRSKNGFGQGNRSQAGFSHSLSLQKEKSVSAEARFTVTLQKLAAVVM